MRLIVDWTIRDAMPTLAPGEEAVAAALGLYQQDITEDYFLPPRRPSRSVRLLHLAGMVVELVFGMFAPAWDHDVAARPAWVVLTRSSSLLLVRSGWSRGARPKKLLLRFPLAQARLVRTERLTHRHRRAHALTIELPGQGPLLGVILFEEDAALLDRVKALLPPRTT